MLIELHGVVGRRHPPDPVDERGRVRACHLLSGEFGERGVQLGRREAGRQDAPQELCVLVVVAEFGEFPGEQGAVVRDGPGASGVQELAGRVEADRSIVADRAGPELDARQVTFPDRPQAHDEPDFPRLTSCLVGMGHHRRIEQGRRLQRVLVAEIRSDQLPSCAPDLYLGPDPVGDELEVALEGSGQVAIPGGESRQRPGQGAFHVLVIQVKDAIDDGHGPRPAPDQGLLAGHE